MPLSLTMVSGRPRSCTKRLNSRATPSPEIEGSANERQTLAGAVVHHGQDAETPAVGHLVSDESRLQRWLAFSGTLIGHRVPMARLRPPRRRPADFSSR